MMPEWRGCWQRPTMWLKPWPTCARSTARFWRAPSAPRRHHAQPWRPRSSSVTCATASSSSRSLNVATPFTSASLPFVQSLADLLALAIDRERWVQRADAVREARRAERTRSEVLATLSHELRMPLSTIKGYTTALLLDELSWTEAKRREFLQLMEIACDDMEVMIRDILDSSLIDVDQLPERRPVSLPALAVEVADELQHRNRRHRLMVDFTPDFPVVPADPHWIRQVLRNLLDNAVKYSPDGGLIVVRGEARRADVVVSVADQGVGISSEDLIPLFERYFRVRTISGPHVPGTGLGLPIARGIVEAHGGRIWVESKVGEGTTILFSLPREEPA
jgi:signal transduction histidine kinase